jgi:hypothetical protein
MLLTDAEQAAWALQIVADNVANFKLGPFDY